MGHTTHSKKLLIPNIHTFFHPIQVGGSNKGKPKTSYFFHSFNFTTPQGQGPIHCVFWSNFTQNYKTQLITFPGQLGAHKGPPNHLAIPFSIGFQSGQGGTFLGTGGLILFPTFNFWGKTFFPLIIRRTFKQGLQGGENGFGGLLKGKTLKMWGREPLFFTFNRV